MSLLKILLLLQLLTMLYCSPNQAAAKKRSSSISKATSQTISNQQAAILPNCNLFLTDVKRYLLPKEFVVMQCFAPVSRSYLYSKYNAAFVLQIVDDAGRSSSSSAASATSGQQMKFSLFACNLDASPELWEEDEVVHFKTPLSQNTALCEATEFDFMVRALSEHSIEYASIIRDPSAVCKWSISFTPAFSGNYSLEVINSWIGGSLEPNRTNCDSAVHDKYWEGGVELVIPYHLHRGPPWMTCCDRCQLFDECNYWTHNFTVDKNKLLDCQMYKTAKGLVAGQKGLRFLSGQRNKYQSDQIYVGGSLMRQSKPSVQVACRTQGHVIKSPLQFHVTASSDKKELVASVAMQKSICTSGELDGFMWVKTFDVESCSEITLSGEIGEALMTATHIDDKVFPDKTYVSRYYHAESHSTIYCTGKSTAGHNQRQGGNRRLRTEGEIKSLFESLYTTEDHDDIDTPRHGHGSGSSRGLSSTPPKHANILHNATNCFFWNPKLPILDSNHKYMGGNRQLTGHQPLQLHPRCKLENANLDTVSHLSSLSYYMPGFEWGSPPTSSTLSNDKRIRSNGCVYKHHSYGSARECLKERGFTTIITRGDSIMNGFTNMLKWFLKTDKERDVSLIVDDSLDITGNIQNSKREEGCGFSFIMDANKIKSCINILKSIFPSTASPTNVPTVNSNNNNNNNNKIKNSNNTAIIFNFDAQHLIWHHDLGLIEKNAIIFFTNFTHAKNNGYFLNATFIYFNGMADHTFREPFCTTQRSQKLSLTIADLARQAGWLVLDAFNMTLLRQDASQDGMHFSDPINYMFMQVLLGMLCSPEGS